MFLIWLLNHHCQYVSVSYTCTVRKWNNFSWCTSKLASTNWLRAPGTGQSTAPGIGRFFSATTFPQGHLQVSALRIFFSSLFRLPAAFRLEVLWKKHCGIPRPLVAALRSGWATQIILEQEMRQGGSKNHKHFCRTAARKDFKIPFGFWHLKKKLNCTKISHRTYRKEWQSQNRTRGSCDISNHPFITVVT